MNPHDLELRLYNDIMHRFEQIEESLHTVYDVRHQMDKMAEDSLYLAIVWCKDAKDKFKRYSEIP